MRRYITSESVTEGHPDKICDQISDAVLDEVLGQDPEGRVACETFVTVGLVVVGGEITTTCYIDIPNLVRGVLADIGYTRPEFGFEATTCAVLNAIGGQSQDIAQGVDQGGAGDQGSMVGYACRETPELMPMPIMLAHNLTRRLAQVRKDKTLKYLGPDGKSQVTVEYQDGRPVRVDTVVIAAQHTEEILDSTGRRITKEAINEIIDQVIKPVIPEELLDENVRYLINATGKFVVGGPQSDTGMTGRKIIMDTYGGAIPHGGGAFSGKDPTKVDRSASYMARYIAKNLVAAGLADRCAVHLAYAIGLPDPVSIMVQTYDTGKLPDERLSLLIKKEFNLTPKGIIEELDLLRPIYKKTACYGHFGRKDFTWEVCDMAEALKRAAGM
jgi:S-adenosylmethionine synthetase